MGKGKGNECKGKGQDKGIGRGGGWATDREKENGWRGKMQREGE